MNIIKQLIAVSGKYLFVSLGTLAIFGILLAITWALPAAENTSYKLITSISATGCVILLGGFTIGKLAHAGKAICQSAVWGLLISFAGFGYLVGIDWKWMAALTISGVLATLGGWISQNQVTAQR